jgi:hypothetical protein
MSKKQLLTTLTGEIFQPARVYYDLFDKETLQKTFSRMKFMDFDSTRNRWVWLFTGKAKGIKFKNRYRDIPKRYQPIVLGSFYLRKEGEMFLEVYSFERATQGISFFDSKIPKGVARVTDITVINKLFNAEVDIASPLDHLFGPEETKIDPEAIIAQLTEAKKRSGLSGVFQIIDEKANEPLPEVERFPTHYYADGIKGLEMTLRMRQSVAFEKWQGNTDFSLHTQLNRLVNGVPSS